MAISLQGGNLIKIGVSTAQRAFVERTLEAVPNGAVIAIRSAINDTLRYARTQLTREVGEVLNLKARDIRDRISIAQKATGADLTGVLRLDYKAVPLLDFRARFSKRNGVTATIFKADGAKQFKHQFRATMASGHVGTFQRDIRKGKLVPQSGRYAGRAIKRGPRKGQPLLRTPIKETFGTSVIKGFEAIQDKSFADLGEYFTKRLAGKVQWQLQKASAAEPPAGV